MKSFLLCFYSYVNFLNGLGEAKAAVFFLADEAVHANTQPTHERAKHHERYNGDRNRNYLSSKATW